MSYEDAPPAYDAAVSSAGPRANARAGGGSTSGADTRHNNASVASQGERVTGVANERQINSSERDITDEQRLLPPGEFAGRLHVSDAESATIRLMLRTNLETSTFGTRRMDRTAR